MDATTIYIALSIVILIAIAILLFVAIKHRKKQRISPLSAVALVFVFSSVLFDNRLYSYSLIGIGFIILLIDIFLQLRKKKGR